MSAPGWYPNPDGSGTQRYFDGANWGPTAPVTVATPPPTRKKPLGCFKTVFGIIGILFVLGMIGRACGSDDNKSSSSSSSSSSVASSWTATPRSSSYTTPTSEAPPTPRFTPAQENAIEKAHDYLGYSSFSRDGLIKQLEFDGFNTADATFAVENIEASNGVNWNEEAVKKAKDYLGYSSFSLQGLIDQLKFDGFTQSQAQYGAQTAYGR